MLKRTHAIDTKTKLLLAGILLIAAFFRFYNLNWDSGNLFHPDERNIANAVSSLTLFSQMDPKFYAYGGFLIYLYKFSADILAILLNNPAITHDWGWINVIGRSYSAFFSTITIFPLYFLGKKVFGHRAGLLACLIYALTVASIQTAHFSTTENLLTFITILITYLSLLVFEKPSAKLSLIIGLTLGIGVATKTTGVVFFLAPTVSLCMIFFSRMVPRLTTLSYLLLMGSGAFLIFSLFSPFTFLNWSKFLESMHYENGVVLGINRVVYTLQFAHTTKYLFQIKNLFWQTGPFAGIIIAGTLLAIWHQIKKRNVIFIIFISFPFVYFIYIGSWYAKFNRYMVPLLPFFILLGSNILILLIQRYHRLGMTFLGLSILSTLIWAIAFFSIYTNTQTRIAASMWIYKNIPSGKFLLSEHWDEGLPVPLSGQSPSSYKLLPLAIYDQDGKEKINYYANYLSEADYVTINSRRLYGTLLELPEKYPITKRYYEYLFSGKLGYEKIVQLSSYPTFMGITFNDDNSEETFQVYDHPKALIFKNTKRLSYPELQTILLK